MALFEGENLLYHYTSASTAIDRILQSGELRLGLFAETNDPRESRSWHMSASIPDGYELKNEDFFGLSDELDGLLRRSVKLTCFTRDDAPRNDHGGASGLGFAHSSLWAHYGGRHAGVCLGFRPDLLGHLESRLGQVGDYFHGLVDYVGDASPPYQATHVDLGQIESLGLEAVLAARIGEYSKELFFTKDQDWMTEREYRCVVLSPDPAPIFIDVSDYLRVVVLGDAFPEERVAAVHGAAASVGDVVVSQLKYWNGRPTLLPSVLPND